MQHTVQINDGQIRARGNQTLTHDETQSTSTAGYHAHLILKRELGEGALEVHPASTLGHRLGRHLVIGGIFDVNTLICASELALMFSRGSFWGLCGGSEKRVLGGVIVPLFAAHSCI